MHQKHVGSSKNFGSRSSPQIFDQQKIDQQSVTRKESSREALMMLCVKAVCNKEAYWSANVAIDSSTGNVKWYDVRDKYSDSQYPEFPEIAPGTTLDIIPCLLGGNTPYCDLFPLLDDISGKNNVIQLDIWASLKSLDGIEMFQSLECLSLRNQYRPTSMIGIEHCPDLKRLVFHAPLENTEMLSLLNLQELALYGASSVSSFKTRLPHLKKLTVSLQNLYQLLAEEPFCYPELIEVSFGRSTSHQDMICHPAVVKFMSSEMGIGAVLQLGRPDKRFLNIVINPRQD